MRVSLMPFTLGDDVSRQTKTDFFRHNVLEKLFFTMGMWGRLYCGKSERENNAGRLRQLELLIGFVGWFEVEVAQVILYCAEIVNDYVVSIFFGFKMNIFYVNLIYCKFVNFVLFFVAGKSNLNSSDIFRNLSSEGNRLFKSVV